MRYSLPLLVLAALLLSACSQAQAAAAPTQTPDTSVTLSAIVSATLSAAVGSPTATARPAPSAIPAVTGNSASQPVGKDMTRTDAQGAVAVDVTPSNLSNPGNTLDFEVGLNTHSVNLNMDIAKLATLKTDTGLTVSASSWSGESGGHHVFGTLTFPAQTDGKAILEGAKVLTLVIQKVDAPERTFTWEVNP